MATVTFVSVYKFKHKTWALSLTWGQNASVNSKLTYWASRLGYWLFPNLVLQHASHQTTTMRFSSSNSRISCIKQPWKQPEHFLRLWELHQPESKVTQPKSGKTDAASHASSDWRWHQNDLRHMVRQYTTSTLSRHRLKQSLTLQH